MHELDGKTGASLKLSILNPKGRIWTMVAGGGASVIYAGGFRHRCDTEHGSCALCGIHDAKWHCCVYSAAVSTEPLT